MATQYLKRWGNSLAVRIPASLADRIHLHEDQEVEVRAERGTLVIKAARRKFKMADYYEFLRTVDPANAPPLVNLGKPIGAEAGSGAQEDPWIW